MKVEVSSLLLAGLVAARFPRLHRDHGSSTSTSPSSALASGASRNTSTTSAEYASPSSANAPSSEHHNGETTTTSIGQGTSLTSHHRTNSSSSTASSTHRFNRTLPTNQHHRTSTRSHTRHLRTSHSTSTTFDPGRGANAGKSQSCSEAGACSTFTTPFRSHTTSDSQTSCQPDQNDLLYTTIEVVHTKTTTFYGNPADYTPPYPPLTVPTYCTGDKQSSTLSSDPGSPVQLTGLPHAPPHKLTITFITTDRNPSVVFPSDPVPSYSYTDDPDGQLTRNVPHHHAEVQSTTSRSSWSITAERSTVIIGRSTITGLEPSETTTVTVGDGTFVIGPTKIIGQGTTMLKPAPAPTHAAARDPTSTFIGGTSVAISGSQATIEGTTLDIPLTASSTQIGGHEVTLGPGSLALDGVTATFKPLMPEQTEVVLGSGQLLTAVGNSIMVLDSTTISYGSGSSVISSIIGSDTIIVGPSGVMVDGTSIGTMRDASATDYMIVGGVTLTELGQSEAIIAGKTYTVGPNAASIVTVIDGETLTIGKKGIIHSSTTFSYPFGTSVVGVIEATQTSSNGWPKETGASHSQQNDLDLEDAAGCLRPLQSPVMAVLAAAIGAWLLA